MVFSSLECCGVCGGAEQSCGKTLAAVRCDNIGGICKGINYQGGICGTLYESFTMNCH